MKVNPGFTIISCIRIRIQNEISLGLKLPRVAIEIIHSKKNEGQENVYRNSRYLS